MANERDPGLVARNYLTAALVLILLIWGPLDHSWPAWLAIRTGYLIAIPVATWWLLKWIWKAWQPDIATEERIPRALFAATAGVLLAMALNEGSAKTHVGGPEWDPEVLPGPDLAELFMELLFAGIAFWLGVQGEDRVATSHRAYDDEDREQEPRTARADLFDDGPDDESEEFATAPPSIRVKQDPRYPPGMAPKSNSPPPPPQPTPGDTGVNPELIAGAGRVVAKFAKAGFKQFQVMIEKLVASLGQAAADRMKPHLESEWDKAQASGDYPGMEPREMPTPVQQEQAVEKQQVADPNDLTLAAVLRKGREANAGKPLSGDQTAELTAMSKEMEEIREQLDVETKRREEAEAKLAAHRQHEQVVKEVKGESVWKKSDRRQKAEKRVEDAWAAFNKATGGRTTNTGFNPELAAGAARVVAKFAKAGFLKFKVMLKKMVDSIGQSEVDKIERVLEQEWDKAYASGEFPGMEPRVEKPQPSSAEPIQAPEGDSNLTSIKNEIVNELRAERGRSSQR